DTSVVMIERNYSKYIADHAEGSLATTLHRRRDCEPRRDHEGVQQVGMDSPQRTDIARVVGHDDVPPDRLCNVVEQLRPLDGLRQRLGLGKRNGVSLLAVIPAA